ncbi:kinesin-like protein KIF26A [Aulostomus maculatus]
MYSQYWNTSRARRPDYRRYTVVEGEAPLPLGSTCCRKRLHSAGDKDDKEARSCASRPNPEGSGGWQVAGAPEEEQLQRLCQRCHIVASQLKRQAAELADTAALKDPVYASFLFDKLQRLQWPRRGRHASVDARCDVCGVSFHQLRRVALRRALGISTEKTPNPVTTGLPPAAATACDSSWNPDELHMMQQRWSYDDQHGGGALWRWGGVQSTYLGGGGAKRLATVTPLPLNTQDCLEGVWRVSCRQPERQQTTGSTPDGGHETMKTSTQDVKPAAHSVATQTGQTPSAAAAFFIRAAQKLSLSRRKKSRPGPPSPPGEAPGPLLYTGGFSGALQLSPPAVPPCLLRAGSKVKDTPGMGKVRVMLRICSVNSSESSESMSFLKVDGRKKQLNLCETPAGVAQRRSSSSAPKTFTFDAIFTQDASQAEVCSGTLAEVIQSVVNGADGCIFCYGHANLGKTYTMIGRECSTQSLGVAPTAISWLFKVIEERREKAGAGFSVRVSAVEISGREETLSDLLADLASSLGGHQEAPGPAVSLWEDPICGSQLQNQTELRATNAERAAFFLDAALAARQSCQAQGDLEARRNSHFLFTLHLYQERLDKTNKAAVSGRSRLHLLDLGSCETDISRTREGGGGQCLSLSALGNVILALANGAKHVPYRDSKLTMLLSESLGNINCRTTMIAHISDSPVNYMETLTTVQLAARIHRIRKKKSKYASSSSGGDSSCEEGPTRQPPHLRPFHPRTVALDPDTPLLLSSDPDHSSSSEHSCDTVIYVGPGGVAISDWDLSDNEGPPSFVPIIPSLNKKRVKDMPRTDGDHFKCNTFAELQERLECIDGSEGSASFSAESKAAQTAALRTQASKPSEATSVHRSDETQRVSPATCSNNKPDQEQFPAASGITDTSKWTSADGEKLLAPSLQDPGPVVQEKVYLKGAVPKASASPSLLSTSMAATQPAEVISRTPPVGMSQQVVCQPPASMDGAPYTCRSPMEVSNLQAALLGRCLSRDFLRTTVTLQQPVELNGEDELVFTIVEELPHGLIPDNGRPSNIVSFSSDCSLQALASGSRPVSIISSINDEYDAFTCQPVESSTDVGASWQETLFAQCSNTQSTVGSWSAEVSEDWTQSDSTGILYLGDKYSAPTPTQSFHREPFLQHSVKRSQNDSSVSELDCDPSTLNKPPNTRCPPDPPKASPKGSRHRANTLNVSVSTLHHSSLPRKTKPTSTATLDCSRQEGRYEDFLLQRSSHLDPREAELLCTGRRSSPSKRPGGNSNSVPRPSKAQAASQRVVDGCEKSSSRRGDALIKLPGLTRGATTLGTVSLPQSSESKWGHEGTLATGTMRFSSLGKKLNGQKSSGISKSGSGSISPPAPPARQLSQEQKTRTGPSPSALKTSSDAGKSFFPKTSSAEGEFTVRARADSFSARTSSLKIEHTRASSSLKKRGAKVDSSRHYGSVTSLERSDSPTIVGSKPGLSWENSGASLGGTNRSNRPVSRLGVPASTSTPASSSQGCPGVFASPAKLGQVKSSSNTQAAPSGGSKFRSLTSSKSLSSSHKPLDSAAGRSAGLTPTGKSPARTWTGVKSGRGTIMGTKQAMSRVANSRVSELAAASQRKQMSSRHGLTGSDSPDSGTCSISGSPTHSPIPSPYSKITAPRRPQHYSSGHGSDNSSILSGELPPAMGRTALFYHSGGSSGYESMIRDSETTGSTSSAHDSMSESGMSSSNRSRVSKSPKKRGNGFQRRRLIPAPLPDTSSLGGKVGGQWVDLPPLGSTLKEPFEIKVYEIDDVERLQRRREAVTVLEPFQDVEKGLLYFNARLRMLEKRQQQIRELSGKHQRLQAELQEAKSRLMLDACKWNGEFDVDQDLDRGSQEYLEALAQATAELEYCVNLCKSRVMMETCFDITTADDAARGGQLEVGGSVVTPCLRLHSGKLKTRSFDLKNTITTTVDVSECQASELGSGGRGETLKAQRTAPGDKQLSEPVNVSTDEWTED